MDILIFGGQSNMEGESERLSESEIVSGAFEYKYLTDSLVPLKNPVGEAVTFDKKAGKAFAHGDDLAAWNRVHLTGSANDGHTNLVPSFCRKYIGVTGTAVTAAHIARGCTKIDFWTPGTDGYAFLKEKTLAARRCAEKAYPVDKVFLVWLQGESDQIAGKTKETYKAQITALKDGLKADVGLDAFGIIRVGRFTGDDRDFEIIKAQDEVCKEDGDFLMLTNMAVELNKIPAYMNPNVGGHYSAAGLEKLGAASGEALGRYKKNGCKKQS